jgi:TolB-like protein/Flp pilus assembly protein TadD
MPLTPNTKLGPYEIVAPLGAGGMGEVYRARDTRLDRDVAVKVLPEQLAGDPLALARFEREAKAVAALSHPNILAIYDVGSHNETAYVVTELLEGETLRQRLGRAAISWRQAVEITVSVADGLSAAHAKGVIHRDLKPENIFITTAGHVKILDFGLARMEPVGQVRATALEQCHKAESTPTMTLATRPGMILGTLNYMSPEQVRGLRTDGRSDIFSLGCVVYEMVAGRRAFTGDTAADTMTAILKEEPAGITDTRTGIRPELERVIARCLEKKPEQRFQSAPDLAFTLRSILADSGATPALKRPRIPWLAKAAIVALVLGGLVVGAFMVRRELRLVRREARETINSLAVLPLENVSRDPEQEYFVDGMTEALISDLAKIGGLKVISRTSVMRYKATTKSLPEIAKELNVDAVVEGSVLRVGDRVRISAQLIHAATEKNLWAESYDRDLRDVLRLQSEVARTIAQEIKVTLTPQEQARMVETRPINPEAYQAYLKGRFYWNKRTSDGLKKAVDYFQQTIALAADWPLGYAGLADAYLLMPEYSSMRTSEAIPKARAAAVKALEMDESLAEAHATMGQIATHYDWNWAIAAREFERLLALTPNYATAHHWYAEHLMITGRHDAAIREITKAQELDPLSLIIGVNVGWVYYVTGDFEAAETRLRRTLELGPDFALAHSYLARTLFLQGRLAEAVTEAREAVRLSNNEPLYADTLGYVCAKAGQPEEAWRILDELVAQSKEAYVAPTHVALVYAGLDERDRMFDWLERAYQERDVFLVYTLPDPLLAPMRREPRFADLVRRVGLPPLAPMRGTDPPLSPLIKGGGGGASPLGKGGGESASPLAKGGQRGVAEGKVTLAVLPFANDSGDSELDYLSDGITETLINGFSRIEGLNTVPRSTAFRHKGDVDPVEVGRQLSATAVLSGRVLKRGDNLTIQADLVDVAEGRQLWGERYQRKFDDLVQIERNIAGDITEALRLRLTGEEKRTLSRGYSENAEAYRLYLEARFWWSKRTKAGFDNALRLLDQAIQLDPSFALAYSGIADTYSLMPMYGFLTPRDAVDKAQAAADRALQLDDQLAEAHTSMGMVRMYGTWDFDRAEKDFQHALQLNPRYPTGHQWCALCVGIRGRLAEARTQLRRAIELDPQIPIFTHNLAWISAWQQDWTEALSTAKGGLEFAPEFPWLHQMAGQALLELGRADESLVHFRRAVELAPLASFPYGYLGYALARAGHEQEARSLLAERLDRAKAGYVPPSDIAAIYVGLGESDAAFEWLEKACEARDTWMVFLGVLPQFESLHSDPRFTDLLRRIGLPYTRR